MTDLDVIAHVFQG